MFESPHLPAQFLAQLTFLALAVGLVFGGSLFRAAESGDLRVIRRLLDRGRDPKATDRQGFTALHHAALNGQTEAVALLLEAGSGVDAVTRDGQTPLQLAAANAWPDVVEILLAAQPNVVVPALLGALWPAKDRLTRWGELDEAQRRVLRAFLRVLQPDGGTPRSDEALIARAQEVGLPGGR